MRHLARVLCLSAAVLAASCATDFNGKIGCASDLDCQTGSHCVDSKCVAGNSPPRIQWKEPAASTFLAGTVTFKVTADDPEGVTKVVLSNGSTVLKTFNAPDASFGKAGPADVTFSVDTSGFADGPLTLTAEGTDSLGLAGGGVPRAFGVANAPAPAGAITASPSPAKKDTVLTITFTTAQEIQGATVTVAGNAATFVSKSGLTQTFSYTVKGTEGEGAKVVSVTTQNLAGVTDTKTGSVTFIFTAPGAPTLTASAPASPGNSTTPKILGTVAAGTVTVALYTAAGCSSTVAASGTAAAFAAPGLTVTVPAQVAGQAAPSTTFFGKATDAAGNVSACSTSSVTYVSKTVAPPAPTFSGSLPASPSNSTATTIKLLGAAEAGSTVQLFANANCAAPAAGGGSAAAFASPGLDVAVPAADGTTVFTARATDAATNVSACSAPFSYVRNTALPSPPAFTATTPGSPFKSAGSTPVAVSVKGTVPPPPGGLAAAGVTLYSTFNCLPASLVVSGTVAGFTGAGLQVQVPKNSARTFWGTVTDVAGNVSGCSPGSITFIEDSAEATPTISSSQPSSPSNLPGTGLFVTLTGTAPTGPSVAPSTVYFYVNDPNCTSGAVASGSAATFTTTGVSVPLLPNASTNYTARSQDSLGNSSGCSAPFNFISDQGDAQPVFAAPSPASPSDTSTTFVLTGTADLGPTLSMVQLYSDAACTVSVPATLVSAADFGTTGVQVSVNPNGGATFYAQSSDAAGNLSPCSAGITLVNDTQESKPVFGAPAPGSPSRTDTQFAVTGLVDHGPFVAPGIVQLYTDAACTAALANASSTADVFPFGGISVTVPSNGGLTVYAQSTDSLGHVSPCSDGLTLVNDATEPNVVFTGASPLLSKASSTFNLTGTAPTGPFVAPSTVNLWASASCTGTPVASGSAVLFAASGIPVTIGANTSSTLYASSSDSLGNSSPGCSSGFTIIHDSIEATPTFTSPNPLALQGTTFQVRGNAGSGPSNSLVALFSNPTCTTIVPSTSSTPAAFASPGISITVAPSSSSTVWARSADAAGNVSACSAGLNLINDPGPEPVPVFTGPNPRYQSAANTTFNLTGNASSTPSPSTVFLYADAACSVTSTNGTAAGFASPGIPVAIAANTAQTFYARARDLALNTSTCTAVGQQVVHDNQEAAPVITGTTEANPTSTPTTFHVKGSGSWGPAPTTIALYTDAACSSSPVAGASATPAVFTSTGIPVSVAANSGLSVWAKASDLAGNTACSAASSTLVVDATETLSGLTVSPASPNSTTSTVFTVKGTAPTGPFVAPSTVYYYVNAPTCPGTTGSSMSAALFGSSGFNINVGANNGIIANFKSIDSLGNVSPCMGVPLINDTQELAPTFTGPNPQTSSSTLTFFIKGTAGLPWPQSSTSTVSLYTDSGCTTSAGVASINGATFASTGFSVTVTVGSPARTYWAKSVDALGNTSLCSATGMTVIYDASEPTPTLTATNPPSPSNTSASTILVLGSANTSTSTAPSTVSLYAGPGCTGAPVASGSASTFVGTGLSVSYAANSSTTWSGLSTDSLNNVSGCSAPLTFVSDRAEPVPSITTSTPASPTVATTGSVLLKGTSTAIQTPGSLTQIWIFKNDSTCNNRVPDTGAPTYVANKPLATFTGAGISVPLVPDAVTQYYALGVDPAGNISTCSAAFAFASVSYCAASGLLAGEVFNANMQGCGGNVTFANRASLCASTAHVCNADEWVANHATSVPAHRYWTDDNLRYSLPGSTACGSSGCNSNLCFVSTNLATTSGACGGNPFQVANVNPDPEGNSGGGWTGCGLNTILPNHYFGGCGGSTGGVLCCAGSTRHWGVDAVSGLDTNPGTRASPFKTITKALASATSGHSVYVKPGTYNTTLGETFPLQVPAGVVLLGDEASRGSPAGGPATLVSGTLAAGAGSTVAGFAITTTSGEGLSIPSAGVTARNNTINANTGTNPIHLTNAATASQVLLNVITNNSSYPRFDAGATGKVENNAFTGNLYGIVLFGSGMDAGGGNATSTGNNTFSCNTIIDVYSPAVNTALAYNKWDRSPPNATSTALSGGQDLYYSGPQTLASAINGLSVTASPCTNCAASAAPVQSFDGFMAGCAGPGTPPAIAYATRGSLCGQGCHSCTASEYVAHRSGQIPATNFWTGDAILDYVSGSSGSCIVSTTTATGSCTGGAMLVCPASTRCNLTQCGLGATTPIEYFGGCSQTTGGFGFADGTLCCCF